MLPGVAGGGGRPSLARHPSRTTHPATRMSVEQPAWTRRALRGWTPSAKGTKSRPGTPNAWTSSWKGNTQQGEQKREVWGCPRAG